MRGLRSAAGRTFAVVVLCGSVGVTANAQSRPPAASKPAPRPHRAAPHAGSVEISGGFAWDGGFDLGPQAATETRNPGTGTGSYTLFTTDNTVGAAYGVVARVGVFVTSSFAIEGGIQYLQPEVASVIKGDAEGAQGLTATEKYSRYVFDVSGVWHLRNLARSAVPFVFGGAGYLRELHDGSQLLETGNEFHGGAGLKYFFNHGPRRYGLRGDISIVSRSGGFDFTEGRRTLPRAGVSFFWEF